MFKNTWEQRSIDKGPKGGRDLETYERWLDFKRESLEGKTVLDLGAGPGGRFAKDLKDSGINARVISLSPDFSDEKQRDLLEPKLVDKIKKLLKGEKAERPLAVAGNAEQLPFKDESFDEILVLFSTSIYSPEYDKWLPEICRTLKADGVGRIGPFYGRSKRDLYDEGIKLENRDDLKDYVAQLGYKYKFIFGLERGERVLILQKTKNEEEIIFNAIK